MPPSVSQKPVVPTPKNHSIHSGHAPKNSPSLISGQAPKVTLGENPQVGKRIPTPPQKIPAPPAQNISAGKQIFSETKPLAKVDVAEALPAGRQGFGETRPKNPFEEKLRQTFTIPSKNPKTEGKKNPDNSKASSEAKKEKIKNNPYLETIE